MPLETRSMLQKKTMHQGWFEIGRMGWKFILPAFSAGCNQGMNVHNLTRKHQEGKKGKKGVNTNQKEARRCRDVIQDNDEFHCEDCGDVAPIRVDRAPLMT